MLVVGILAALIVQAEPVDLGLVLPPKTVIDYRLEERERIDGGEWETTTSRYHVEVVPIDETSFETRWRDVDASKDAVMAFLTDEALTPTRLLNPEDVIEAIVEMVEAEDPGSKDNAATVTFFRNMGVEAITALVGKNFVLTSFGQGTYLVPGEEVRYQQPSGTFGDGEPMMMNASFLLESIEPGSETAVVNWVTEIDPESSQKALPGLVADLLGLADMGDPTLETKMAELMETARLEKRTQCRYEIDIATGLALHTQCDERQEIQVGGESQRKERKLIATQSILG